MQFLLPSKVVLNLACIDVGLFLTTYFPNDQYFLVNDLQLYLESFSIMDTNTSYKKAVMLL